MTTGINNSINDVTASLAQPHAHESSHVLNALNASQHGLTLETVQSRLEQYGANTLPSATPDTLPQIFLRQFLSPLIYVLLLAALVSIVLQEWSDAGFIFGVLLINAFIGTYQEYCAQRSSHALKSLISSRTRVLRDGEAYEIDAQALVPGDIVLLESGSRVPADLRLLDSQGLSIDESLLTGESEAAVKQTIHILSPETALGDCSNMAFAATMVNHGRGSGVVVSTGLNTALGNIATAVISSPDVKPPLLLRMERFTTRIALLVGIAALLMMMVSLGRGMPLEEIFILAVALAVSAIPEGLPVALTIALAIGMNRMAKRSVIVRRLVAVETLGSCTFIASDKTGTLTVNELTVRQIALPNTAVLSVSGEGMIPDGHVQVPEQSPALDKMLNHLCRAAVLCNEGFLGRHNDTWSHHGDAVDVALLVLAHKIGLIQPEVLHHAPPLAQIPYEPERQYAAALNQCEGLGHISVKGALEKILPMCASMQSPNGNVPLDADAVEHQAHELAAQGFRVLAVADGSTRITTELGENTLQGLRLLGLTAMIDPLRPQSAQAIADCRRAGIDVCMITGDHPVTALAIARELSLADDSAQVITGAQLKEAALGGPNAVARLVHHCRVFARVEPQQKLDIVQALQRNGHFVAVTGDGANDAPALKAAHVGVAMGGKGTDVARETAQLVITDDNFASIVAGIEEGRVAYANVRKVIFLLISTGAAELVLFTLALLAGLPLPLMAVQLLWLNLITNGIQDVALAFEPAEGDELRKPPRPPKEAIFNRLMLERVIISAFTMGCLAFAAFHWLLAQGMAVDQARNSLLLLMVLFENVHVFNCRSELRSAFAHNPLRNRLLLFGTLAAQLIHLGAMFTPGFQHVLGLTPVDLSHWLQLLFTALILLLIMELHKLIRRIYPLK